MSRRQLIVGLCCAAAVNLMLATSVVAQAPQPLLQIYIWKYAGGDQSAERQALIETFRSIIQDKIDTLRSKVSANNGASYVGGLKVDLAHQDEALTDAQAAWSAGDALLLMSGIVNPPESGTTLSTVTTSVYIGDLGRQPLSPIDHPKFTVSLVVSAEELGRIQDAHSLLTLYALTLDAMRTGQPRDIVARLLADAENIAKDLELAGFLTGETKQVHDALKKIRIQLQAAP